jgi:integrase
MAYLFSCYCGLRIGDIENLRWGDIAQDGSQWRIQIVMRKTGNPLYLPLSKQALKWMPERGDAADGDFVFDGLPVRQHANRIIREWAEDAGITKHLSYHTARHTFATMMLTLGADLYTTSKLLGHTKVATTEIYAKIVNSKKDEAVNLVDKVFD